MEMVASVRESAALDWKAAAWWLKQQIPDAWGRDNVNIKISLEKMTDEEIRRAVEEGKNEMLALEVEVKKELDKVMGKLDCVEEEES